nr:hypothetical protein B0A51_05547 [Rachicladosporium sp. CCFEE 5018]
MSSVCHLLKLPGELHIHIYYSILSLQGIELINEHIRLHPLGRTCRQLKNELTAHTAERATDASIIVHARIVDFDFTPVATWLAENPPGPDEVRSLAIRNVVLPSLSTIGLPFDGEDNCGYQASLLPVSDRRTRKIRYNIDTWYVGDWERRMIDSSLVVAHYDGATWPRDTLSYFDFLDERTSAQYAVTLALQIQDTQRYAPAWPTPRLDATVRFLTDSNYLIEEPHYDYAHRLRFCFDMLAVGRPNIVELLGEAVADYMRSSVYNRLDKNLFDSQSGHGEPRSMHPDWKRVAEKSHSLYDANVMRMLIRHEVMRGGEARKARALKQADYSLKSKREAEDDQIGSRKARCLNDMNRGRLEPAREAAEHEDGPPGWHMERMVASFGRLTLEQAL